MATVSLYSAPTPPPVAPDDPNKQASVSTMLDLQALNTNLAADVEAEAARNEGLEATAAAYEVTAGIADKNAYLTNESEQVQIYQQQREYKSSLGAQEAAAAANGFGYGGSSLSILRDSMMQGALGAQLISQQSNIAEAGYIEQGAAARSSAAAARNAIYAVDRSSAETADTGPGEDFMEYDHISGRWYDRREGKYSSRGGGSKARAFMASWKKANPPTLYDNIGGHGNINQTTQNRQAMRMGADMQAAGIS